MKIDRIIERLGEMAVRNLNFRLRSPSGVVSVVNSREEWVVYDEIFQLAEYDSAIDEAFTPAPQGPACILDLGANVGYFPLRVLDRWRVLHGDEPLPLRLVGVEGVPAVYASLQGNLSVNGLGPVADYRLGLAGRRDGAERISTGRHRARNRIGGKSLAGWIEPKQTIPFVDLEKLLKPDERIALIKCDIEGAEELFIESYPGLLARTEALVIEFHHRFCNVPRCYQKLAEAGLVRVRERRPQDDLTVEYYRRHPGAGSGRSGPPVNHEPQ